MSPSRAVVSALALGGLGAALWAVGQVATGHGSHWQLWLVGGLSAVALAALAGLRMGPGGRFRGTEADGAAEEARRFQSAVKRTMVGMMLADGAIDDWEPATIKAVYARLLDADFPEAEIRKEVAAARSEGKSVGDVLGEMAPVLDDGGRRVVLRAAVAVAMADGSLHEREQALLEEIAGAISAPPGLLDELTADVPR